MKTVELETRREEMVPITRQVQAVVEQSGVKQGACVVYCPHTTAGITINENADPDVQHDILLALGDVFAGRDDFLHMEGNSAAHLKAAFVGSSATIPVEDGRLALGRWQGVYFCEFDGPRRRRFTVQVLGRQFL